ncbi:MAG TPA: hypothetical protein VE442_18500 [Jatrophihabitans sp.]|jgi:predicted transcriptional regulator|nr:hypothetical protein [Jatrophihabitans sp.]
MTTTVRVSDETHARLAALSAATGKRMQTIVEAAVAAYERDQFWAAFDAGYDALASDSEQWAGLLAERESESRSMTDDVG